MHIKLHLRAARKVDAQVEQVFAKGQQDERHQTGRHQQHGNAAEDLAVFDNREAAALALFLAQAVCLRIADVEIHHAVEQEVGDRQRGEHGDDNAKPQRSRKADDRARAEEEQHGSCNQRGQVRVQDRRERTLEARVDRTLDRLARAQFFLDALEDNDVGIHRHADRQDDACDARQGQVDADDAEYQRLNDDVEAQREAGHEARHAVNDDHKQAHQDQADQAGHQAGAHCVRTQLRADRAQLGLLQAERQLACIDQTSELLCAALIEAARNHTAFAVDAFRNIRRRNDLTVHDDQQLVIAVRTCCNRLGRICKLLLALAGELNLHVVLLHRGAAGGVTVLRACTRNIRTGQQRILRRVGICILGQRGHIFIITVDIHEQQLGGRAERLHCFLRIGDLRDLDGQPVVARQRDRRLGKALAGQALADHRLRGLHIIREVAHIITVRQHSLVYDTRAADQIQAEADTMLGIQYARNDRGQFGIGSRRGVIRAGIPCIRIRRTGVIRIRSVRIGCIRCTGVSCSIRRTAIGRVCSICARRI